MDTTDLRKGLKVEIDNQPYIVVDAQFVNPGKGSAFTRTKMKNLLTGSSLERTFRSGEKVDEADIEERKMQYMYQDAEGYNVMDTKNYEQICLNAEQVGDRKNYFQEGISLTVLFWNGRAISVETPNFVVLKVVKTDPGVKGDTVSGGVKPAELESGAVVQVPLYLNEGEKIKVDTRTNSYVERAE